MRGKVISVVDSRCTRGITPAYAGKSPLFAGVFQHIQGSPPPMRGKVSRYIDTFRFYRITPAYAGKSQCNTISAKNKKDHPRLCWEKHFWAVE